MAKLLLTIQANDKASESVRALKTEVQALSKSLSSIKVTASGVETTRKGYANLITTLKTLKSQYADGVFGNLPQDAERAFKKIQEISAAFQESGKLTKEQAKAYAQLSQQLKKYTADLATVKAKNDKIVAANPFTVTQAQQIPRLIKQYSTLLTTLRNTEKYYPKGTFDTFKADLTQGQADLQALNQEFLTTGTLSQDSQVKLNNLANGYNQLNASIAQTTSTMKSSKGGLKDIVSGFFKFQLAAMLVMKPLQMIRSALTSINETLVKTEDAVIALQRVLPTGSATDSEISGKVYDIAERYGQTFENVSTIAQNFARSGMDWADTIKATEAAVLALNVAELDAEEATIGLNAILSQFHLTASDLESVIDKLNKTADNFPVTTEKILAALQRTGSAADSAKLSLEQTIALITALSKATGRSGENIGTALNSLIQYSSKKSALDTFAALSDESAAVVERFRQGGANILDVWQQVSKEIQNLKSDQADLLDQYFATADGEALKDALDGELEDIYTELGGVYDTANTFRKNYFIALLGNMDTVERAMGTLGDAAGYSQKENEKYLATYTAKLNTVKAQWQDIANDEQGLLGIKKDLVELGSGVLDIIKGLGGLKSVLAIVAMWVTVIIAEVKGAAIAAGLQKVLGVITNIATLGIPNLIKQIKLAKQGIAEVGAVAKAATSTALLALTVILTAVSAIDSAIRRSAEERAEAERKAREEQDAAIAAANAEVDAQKKEVQSMEDVAASVENLRNILDDSTTSEDEKRKAQAQLLQIQNSLVESNNAYKDSLDLTNGSLKEQLGLIEQLTTEQLKQKAQDFLAQNKSEIEVAKSRLESESTTNTEMILSGDGKDRFRFQDIIGKAIEGAGIGDTAQIIEDNVYGMYHGYFKDVGDAWNESGLWGAIGALFNPFDDFFSKEGWVGSASAGFTFSGTVEEQIKAIQALQKYIADNRDELGLTAEEHTHINAELEKQLGILDSEDYQQAKLLEERAKATHDFLDGAITEAEYLEKVYGITKETADEIGEWHNDITKVIEAYDDLIDKLEELRDLQKETLDLEEKKKAVLEAQKALEDARNEATVRRFNEATGQWEWQTDEKAIAEAEENLEEARKDLEEQAYDTIIDQLEQQTATNESILAIIEALVPLLGEEWAEVVKAAILDKTGVDLDKPVIDEEPQSSSPSSGASSSNGSGGGGRGGIGGGGGIVSARSYDSGGAAIGKGLMPKATDETETVNGPDLTEKILSPVSNAHFDRYVRDMGLLFETARQYAQTPVVERVSGNTDNRVDNSGQVIIKDVNVGAEQRNNLLGILALGGIVPNV